MTNHPYNAQPVGFGLKTRSTETRPIVSPARRTRYARPRMVGGRNQLRWERTPLKYRVPNPPPLFVGREDGLQRLEAALERAPLALVCGPAGIGKSALVAQWVHTAAPTRGDRVIYLRQLPGQPNTQLVYSLLRTLRQAEAVEDRETLIADLDVAFEEILSLAEAGAWWVVLDDVRQDQDEGGQLLTTLSTYASQSRWIAISESPPPGHANLAGQVVQLGGLSDAMLMKVAKGLSPSSATPDAFDRAVLRAAGSPWMLLRALDAVSAEQGSDRHLPLLHPADPTSARALRVLALAAVPLSRALLSAFGPLPDESLLGDLERSGLLSRTSGGLQLHDLARNTILRDDSAHPELDALKQRFAIFLGQREEPEALVEAVRLAVELDDSERVSEILSREGDNLIRSGYAPWLWSVLERSEQSFAAAWRLRCASLLGNPTILGQVRRPASGKSTEHLAWVRALFAQADPLEALDELEALLVDPDAHVRAEAQLLQASCLRCLGHYPEAEAVLEKVRAPAPALERMRQAVAFRLHAESRGVAVDEARAALALVERDKTPHLAAEIANALLIAGDVLRAGEVIEMARGIARGADLALLASRELHVAEAVLCIHLGRLERAHRMLRELEPYVRTTSQLRARVQVARALLRLAWGDLEGFDVWLEAACTEVRGIDAGAFQVLSAVRSYYEGCVASGGGSKRSAAPGIVTPLVGFAVVTTETPKIVGDPALVAALQAHRDAAKLLAAGDYTGAQSAARAAARALARVRLLWLAAEAALVLGDAALCANDPAAAKEAADQLVRFAELSGAPRFECTRPGVGSGRGYRYDWLRCVGAVGQPCRLRPERCPSGTGASRSQLGHQGYDDRRRAGTLRAPGPRSGVTDRNTFRQRRMAAGLGF